MAYDISTLLYQWESYGIFDYLLPLLLIFAVVFGLLTSSNFITKERKINLFIALAIAFLSLRFGFVEFLAQVFPRLGVGIAVILVVVILTAAFIPKEHLGGWLIVFYTLGAFVAIIVLYNAFDQLNWFGSFRFWNDYTGVIIGVLAVIGVIIALSVASGEPKPGKGITIPITPLRQ